MNITSNQLMCRLIIELKYHGCLLENINMIERMTNICIEIMKTLSLSMISKSKNLHINIFNDQ